MNTSQEERDQRRIQLAADALSDEPSLSEEECAFQMRLLDDADTLARIREKNLLRSEIDAPEDAVAWHKESPKFRYWVIPKPHDPRVWIEIRTPNDYRPDTEGPITLAIAEDE